MVSYLCNFIKSGNPNGNGLAQWNKCRKDKDIISFGNDITPKGRMKMLVYNTLTNKPVGE
jgi:carboxylesterase type B